MKQLRGNRIRHSEIKRLHSSTTSSSPYERNSISHSDLKSAPIITVLSKQQTVCLVLMFVRNLSLFSSGNNKILRFNDLLLLLQTCECIISRDDLQNKITSGIKPPLQKRLDERMNVAAWWIQQLNTRRSSFTGKHLIFHLKHISRLKLTNRMEDRLKKTPWTDDVSYVSLVLKAQQQFNGKTSKLSVSIF